MASSIAATQPSSDVGAKVQMSLLKKALESQQSQTADLMKMLEGKGKVIDIRA